MTKLTQEEAVKKYSTDKLRLVGEFINCDTKVDYKCFCGKVKKIRPTKVKSGEIKSCGCSSKNYGVNQNLTKDEIAKKYSTEQLMMIGDYVNSWTKIDYKCACGNIIKALPYKVFALHTTSCGCLKQTQLSTVLTPEQQQIFDGLVISDATIYKCKSSINPSFALTSITKSFIDKTYKNLPFKWQKLFIRPHRENNGSIRQKAYCLRSSADKSLLIQYHRWYKYDKKLKKTIKVIPEDLKLSPIMVKYWFYGDGCTVWANKKYVHLSLHTEGFTKEECEFLISKFNDIDIHFSLADRRNPANKYNKNRGHILLCTKTKDINKFLDYIGKCDIKDFNYKWKRPKTEYGPNGEKYVIADGIKYNSYKEAAIALNIHVTTLQRRIKDGIYYGQKSNNSR